MAFKDSDAIKNYPCLVTPAGYKELDNYLKANNITDSAWADMNEMDQEFIWWDLVDHLIIKYGADLCKGLKKDAQKKAGTTHKKKEEEKKKEKKKAKSGKAPENPPDAKKSFTVPWWTWLIAGVAAAGLTYYTVAE
jgi:hypothetical protein